MGLIVVLNGPLGIGKSTLGEALAESIDGCVFLDGDALVAANPAPADAIDHLHATICLLVEHHRRFAYEHFVIDHIWSSPDGLDDLRRRLASVAPDSDVHCFLLGLDEGENLRRIERRAAARARDETAFERRTVAEERRRLGDAAGADLGAPFDVSDPPDALVDRMRRLLGLELDT